MKNKKTKDLRHKTVLLQTKPIKEFYGDLCYQFLANYLKQTNLFINEKRNNNK